MAPHSLDQRTVQRRLFVAVALPILLLTLLAASFLGLIAYLRTAAAWEQRTDATLSHATRILTLSVDQETGLRGYLLTNDIDFLAPYQRAAPRIEVALVSLENLVREDVLQRERLASVRKELQDWQAYATEVLATKQSSGALDEEIYRSGKRRMDAIRADLAAFMASEEAHRVERNARAASASNLVIALSLLGSLALGIILALSARQQIQQVAGEYGSALAASQVQARELEAGAARFEALFALAPVGIALLRDQTVLAANRAFVAMFGYGDVEAVLGQSWTRLVSSNKPESSQEPAAYLKEAHEGEQADQIGVRANGETFPFRVQMAQIDLHDGVAQVAYLVDQTAQRQLEQQVLQMQKLESMGRLAGGIAHDFNNLLTVITSAVDLAESTLAANRTALADLMLIRQTVDRGSALTRQLLAVASRQPSYPTEVNLNQLILELQPLLHLMLGSQVDLQLMLAPKLWQIEADQGQIEQVVLNLVVNARDAMPNGGRITIEATNVVVDDAAAQRNIRMASGPYVRLMVRDNGIGMSEEVQARLFEPFFTTKGPERGTGLGLATTYGIITQHHGHIAVASEPGQGTTFEVYLPPAAAKHEARAIGAEVTEDEP